MGERLWVIGQIGIKTIGLMVASPMFWLTLWFTYCYYKKYEWNRASAGYLALASLLEGILAGILVVGLILILGLGVEMNWVLYCLGPVSLCLSMIKPRFFCMAYGAGVTILIAKLLGYGVDVNGITSLVAVLHMAEGILVLLFGGRHTTTIFRQSHQRLLPQRGIYRFWPVPVGLLLVMEQGSGGLEMPHWWPLLQGELVGSDLVLGLLPIAVTLGYADFSEGEMDVCSRRLLNGMLILSYAAVLLLFSLAAGDNVFMEGVSLFFMVIGHEMIMPRRRRRPKKKELESMGT